MKNNNILLKDFAKVVRSKNAGPFEVTFDIIFNNRNDFNKFKEANVLNKKVVSKLYSIAEEDIITFVHFEVANAVKFTLPRRRRQGSEGETDMHQAQQYIPLMTIKIPL